MGILVVRRLLEAPFQAKVFRIGGDLKSGAYETDRLEGLLRPDHGIVITENQAIPHPVVVAVFDHVNRRPGDEKFFEVKLRTVKEMDRARDETG